MQANSLSYPWPRTAGLRFRSQVFLLGWTVLGAWLGTCRAVTAASLAESLATFTSKHYTIHTNLSRQEAEAFGRHMDLIFVEYSRRFGSFRKRSRQPMPLYLLRTRQQYIRLLDGFGFNASASGGMFFVSKGVSGLATWIEGPPRSLTFETLQHEGFHQFAYAYIGRGLPVWVNEGLAEYFGDGLVVRTQMKVGLAAERRVRAVQQAIRQNTVIEFDSLLAMTGQQWHQNMLGGSSSGRLQYDQSWSVVYFLIHGGGGKYRRAFERYLTLVNTGRLSDTAFKQAFGTEDTRAFGRQWQRYMLALEPDELTTAVANMQFMGRGLQYLREHNKPIPATTESLRQSLVAVKFRLVWLSRGAQQTIRAEDDSVYHFRRRNGSQGMFELLEPEGVNLLPRIFAPGLRPEPTLVWASNGSGQLESQINYK